MKADEVRRVTTRVAKSVLRSSSYDVARDGEPDFTGGHELR